MKRVKNILQSKNGMALITVILILSILVAAALELNHSTRADVYDAANVSDGIRLSYIAKSGFYAASALLANAKNDYETLHEDWVHAEMLSVQSRSFFPNGHFVVRIDDEMGKIPLNVLPGDTRIQAVLKRLLMLPEFDLDEMRVDEIVQSIIDWIDEDDTVTGRGAESSYYLSLSAPYTAKNAPLDCIEELLMIKGVTPELYAGTKEKPGLAQLVTVHRDKGNQTGAVNINTTPKLVLRALHDGVSVELADRMDEYRKNRENKENLKNVEWYKKVPGAEGVAIDRELIEAKKSAYFRITSTGVQDKMEYRITGAIHRGDNSFSIISWRQD